MSFHPGEKLAATGKAISTLKMRPEGRTLLLSNTNCKKKLTTFFWHLPGT